MSVTSPSPLRRVLAAALAASLLLVGLLAAPALGAGHDYPASEKRAFMQSCVPAAVDSSAKQLTRKQATTYCRSTLTCVERKLTLSEFAAAVSKPKSANGRIVKQCQKQAIAKALG
jgi:hypothetical protein